MATLSQQVASVRLNVQDRSVRNVLTVCNPLTSRVAFTLLGLLAAPVVLAIEIGGTFHGQPIRLGYICSEALYCLRALWTA